MYPVRSSIYPHLAGNHPPAALPSIKKPQWSGVSKRVQATVTQFFLQAMPIFLTIFSLPAIL
ncbi:hypothetical protein GCM10010965_24800 [Caldalkalibacillus thermarum]|nr:hypothetical protein GCM10010965_24800 [Caldalkalibacillus thermarum]